MEKKELREVAERAKEEQYTYLNRKCFSSLLKASENLAFRQYDDTVCLLYDVFEFCWKSLRHLVCHDVQTLKQHLPTRNMWNSFMPRLKGLVILDQEYRELLETFGACNPRWVDNPQERLNARYGVRSFDEQQAELMMRQAELLARILAKAQRRLAFQQDSLNVGILSGYFGRDVSAEKTCDQAPWGDYEEAGVEGWAKALVERSRSRLAISKIPITQMDARYLVVVNPFGETYPELPSTAGILPGFQMIRDYIYSGGAFVTAGGHPFSYLFDVMKGTAYDTSTLIRDIPVSITATPSQDGKINLNVLRTTLAVKTLLQQHFGVETTWDEPAKNQEGPVLCEVFQNQGDDKYWNSGPAKLPPLNEFRSFESAHGGHPVGVLRATRLGVKEVYPIGFVRYGFGLLLHIGLALNKGRRTEFNVAADAVSKGLLERLQSYTGGDDEGPLDASDLHAIHR